MKDRNESKFKIAIDRGSFSIKPVHREGKRKVH